MGPDKKPIQLRHRFGEIEAICVIFAQLTTEKFVPRALIEFAACASFVVDPEAEVRISACQMVEQFLCLLSRGKLPCMVFLLQSRLCFGKQYFDQVRHDPIVECFELACTIRIGEPKEGSNSAFSSAGSD